MTRRLPSYRVVGANRTGRCFASRSSAINSSELPLRLTEVNFPESGLCALLIHCPFLVSDRNLSDSDGDLLFPPR